MRGVRPQAMGQYAMPLLEVRDIVVRFGGVTAVAGVSFDVEAGQICGLIGPNGSGKSTTFNLLAGMFEPTSGHVMFDGQPMLGLSSSNICKRGVARTFQIPRPFRDEPKIQPDGLQVPRTRRPSGVFFVPEYTEAVWRDFSFVAIWP